ITVTKLNQSTVTVSPASTTIAPGESVLFTASGGTGDGDYVWGGAASGTGSTKLVEFSTTGLYAVTVYKASDATYNQSNTAEATVDATSVSIIPASAIEPISPEFGTPVSLVWAATATLGIAWREGSVTLPDGSVVSIPRTWHYQAGMLGPQAFSTPLQGVYEWTARYADMSVATGPPLTYGTGYREETVEFLV